MGSCFNLVAEVNNRRNLVLWVVVMSKFLEAWQKIESDEARPSYLRNLVDMEYAEFEAKVNAQEPRFVNELVESLYAGDIYILRQGFSKEFMTALIDKVYEIWSRSSSSFHQMIEGCPDFHRMVDEEVAKKLRI